MMFAKYFKYYNYTIILRGRFFRGHAVLRHEKSGDYNGAK